MTQLIFLERVRGLGFLFAPEKVGMVLDQTKVARVWEMVGILSFAESWAWKTTHIRFAVQSIWLREAGRAGSTCSRVKAGESYSQVLVR